MLQICSWPRVSKEDDPNLPWFQQDHDFKIMTRQQMNQIERMKKSIQPTQSSASQNQHGTYRSGSNKLNATAPAFSTVSKKRTCKEMTKSGNPTADQTSSSSTILPPKKLTVQQVRKTVDVPQRKPQTTNKSTIRGTTFASNEFGSSF